MKQEVLTTIHPYFVIEVGAEMRVVTDRVIFLPLPSYFFSSLPPLIELGNPEERVCCPAQDQLVLHPFMVKPRTTIIVVAMDEVLVVLVAFRFR